ncbi:MAG TPA: T9SS type A sorting domain-containing protein [Balneolales bacterium]|nr:T9SS type A sorting domain-containing protein [Balneolales bacterium]
MKTTIPFLSSIITLFLLSLFIIQAGYAQSGFIEQNRDSLIQKKLPNYHRDTADLKTKLKKRGDFLLKTATQRNPDVLQKKVQAQEWLEHTVESQWNETNNNYEDLGRTYYAYDSNDNQTDQMIQVTSTGQWVNYYRYIDAYNSNNQIQSEQELSWNGSSWEKIYLTEYTYNSASKQTLMVIKDWYGTDWVNDYRIETTYNSSGTIKEELHKVWDGYEWVNYGKIGHEYDGAGNDTAATVQISQYDQWYNYSKDTYQYDSSNNLTVETDLYWDGYLWQNNYQIRYTYYTGSDVKKMVLFYWNYTQWDNSDQILFEYTTDDQISLATYQVFDGSQWVNDYQYKMSFNSNGNLTQTLENYWLNNAWTQYWKTSNVYSPTRPESVPTPLSKDYISTPARIQLFQNYPNPFNPSTQIKYELPAPQDVRIRIYDVTGRLVGTLVNGREPAGVHVITFQNHYLSSGLYIYQLQAGNQIITKKMLLIK